MSRPLICLGGGGLPPWLEDVQGRMTYMEMPYVRTFGGRQPIRRLPCVRAILGAGNLDDGRLYESISGVGILYDNLSMDGG